MSTLRMTITILLAVTALLICWDAYAIGNATPGDTITEVIRGVVKRYPIIAFALGVVAGHLFWPN